MGGPTPEEKWLNPSLPPGGWTPADVAFLVGFGLLAVGGPWLGLTAFRLGDYPWPSLFVLLGEAGLVYVGGVLLIVIYPRSATIGVFGEGVAVQPWHFGRPRAGCAAGWSELRLNGARLRLSPEGRRIPVLIDLDPTQLATVRSSLTAALPSAKLN